MITSWSFFEGCLSFFQTVSIFSRGGSFFLLYWRKFELRRTSDDFKKTINRNCLVVADVVFCSSFINYFIRSEVLFWWCPNGQDVFIFSLLPFLPLRQKKLGSSSSKVPYFSIFLLPIVTTQIKLMVFAKTDYCLPAILPNIDTVLFRVFHRSVRKVSLTTCFRITFRKDPFRPLNGSKRIFPNWSVSPKWKNESVVWTCAHVLPRSKGWHGGTPAVLGCLNQKVNVLVR